LIIIPNNQTVKNMEAKNINSVGFSIRVEDGKHARVLKMITTQLPSVKTCKYIFGRDSKGFSTIKGLITCEGIVTPYVIEILKMYMQKRSSMKTNIHVVLLDNPKTWKVKVFNATETVHDYDIPVKEVKKELIVC